jgi:starch phosphorylase
VPAASAYRRRAADHGALARELERWARHLDEHWARIRFGDVTRTDTGARVVVSVPVDLGEIPADWVRVELYADATATEDAFTCDMPRVHAVADSASVSLYRVSVETTRPSADYTPRVVPFHPDARIPLEMPLIAWPD